MYFWFLTSPMTSYTVSGTPAALTTENWWPSAWPFMIFDANSSLTSATSGAPAVSRASTSRPAMIGVRITSKKPGLTRLRLLLPRASPSTVMSRSLKLPPIGVV